MEDSGPTQDPRFAWRRRPATPRIRRALWIACACLPGVLACAVSHSDTDRTALREDHEHCLQDARSEAGRVSYRGYQACMDTLGWPAVDVLPASHPG
jgi:hypothetical protein